MHTTTRKTTSAAVAASVAAWCATACAGAPPGPRTLAANAFADEFAGDRLHPGWSWTAGDGDARVTFAQAGGAGTMVVDATADRRNIWWAYIRHAVTPAIDVATLAAPGRELRVEARVRTDTAPRRINLHVNHSRTTDFHSHLREYDLPRAREWHTVSMTTEGFDARPGDDVHVQLALMDWGRETYRLDVDYLRVTVVGPGDIAEDEGRPLPYRPAVSPPGRYGVTLPAAAAATVDAAWPGVGSVWHTPASDGGARRLVAGGTATALLRFSLPPERRPQGWGVLELATEAVVVADTALEGFAELRVCELLGGPSDWPGNVALGTLLGGRPWHELVNEQPMIDVAPAAPGSRTLVPVSPPVLERLWSGESPGLALLSQGGVIALFAADGADGPRLHYDAAPAPPQSPND